MAHESEPTKAEIDARLDSSANINSALLRRRFAILALVFSEWGVEAVVGGGPATIALKHFVEHF